MGRSSRGAATPTPRRLGYVESEMLCSATRISEDPSVNVMEDFGSWSLYLRRVGNRSRVAPEAFATLERDRYSVPLTSTDARVNDPFSR
jgi:hypothetical protein